MPDIGLREILMIAVAATAAYLLLSLLRLVQIARRKPGTAAAVPAERSEPGGAFAAAADEASLALLSPPIQADAVPAETEEPKQKRRWLPQWVRAKEELEEAEAAAPRGLEPGAVPEPFGEHLFRTSLEAELQHLRSDVAGLREELKLLKTARRVSPQYNEAMMMAQRGGDAQGIAEQCGISVGEAELVLALSRNKQEYEDHGEDDPQRSAG